MKKQDDLITKLFTSIGMGGTGRVPLRTNIFGHGGGRGYSPIGQTGRSSFGRGFGIDRESPLLGTATPSNRLSGFYDRISELKGYHLLDISRLAVNLFRDYIINFLVKEAQQVVTVLNEDGSTTNQNITDRINSILTKDIKIFDFIEDHIGESIYYGNYCAMLMTSRDELGHLKFRVEELYDPVSVVIRRKKNISGSIDEVYLARGEDGEVYEIPKDEAFCIGSTNLRLINDISNKSEYKPVPSSIKSGTENRDKVMKKESYIAGEPLFYSLLLKVKELVVKELLVSLISLRDLSSPTLFGLAVDKNVPIETVNSLCDKTKKMASTYNELASFLTAQFDIPSFIETTLAKNIEVFPDYGGAVTGKTSLLPLDKLSDKLIEVMQTVDTARQAVLSPLGIPQSIYDSASGTKWAILQQSERVNSRVSSLMSGIKSSVIDLVCSIYRRLYNGEEIDPSLIKIHIFEKSSVEYNNQINQSESINNLLNGIASILNTSLQTLEASGPLLDPEMWLSYIQNLIKDIDPSTESLITEETIQAYKELFLAKQQQQREQFLGSDM